MPHDSAKFMLGWSLDQAGSASLLLTLLTVPTVDEIPTAIAGQSEPTSSGAIMTPRQALDLAEVLRRKALAILATQPTGPSVH